MGSGHVVIMGIIVPSFIPFKFLAFSIGDLTFLCTGSSSIQPAFGWNFVKVMLKPNNFINGYINLNAWNYKFKKALVSIKIFECQNKLDDPEICSDFQYFLFREVNRCLLDCVSYNLGW